MKKLFSILVIALFVLSLGTGLFAAQSGSNNVVVGSTTGTGAAINVSVGFTPSVVLVSRVSATAANNYQGRFLSNMTDGYMILHGPSALTYVTTAGISKYTGSTSASKGFTIGTNSSLNVSGDTLFWEAWR